MSAGAPLVERLAVIAPGDGAGLKAKQAVGERAKRSKCQTVLSDQDGIGSVRTRLE
jgi:hypothetical protein